MRTAVGRVAAFFALAKLLAVNAADQRCEYDFHVSNEQLNGVQRTVVNGQ